MTEKIDPIKLRYFLNWYPELHHLVRTKLKIGESWPLEIDIDQDTSILIHEFEWSKVEEAHKYYST